MTEKRQRRKQSTGICTFCGKEMTRSGLARHLPTCDMRLKAIQAAEQGQGAPQKLFHLQVSSADSSDFWLHLEMNGEATLKRLDEYLRAIWLECCGHLSRFSFGSWGDEIAMRRKAEDIFVTDAELVHVYDFGTSSYTLIKPLSFRIGRPLTRHPIYLMARNTLPEANCSVCGEPATCYCMQCLVEEDRWNHLCDRHGAEHPHDEYGEPMLLVNSPRVGLCGYEGPAEPPY